MEEFGNLYLHFFLGCFKGPRYVETNRTDIRCDFFIIKSKTHNF